MDDDDVDVDNGVTKVDDVIVRDSTSPIDSEDEDGEFRDVIVVDPVTVMGEGGDAEEDDDDDITREDVAVGRAEVALE